MQMFVLDSDPCRAAWALADCHIRVIGREVAMCLSSWYSKNLGYKDELPYKEFNHPIIEQLANAGTRLWALCYSTAIFVEFSDRFGKEHASSKKLDQILSYRWRHDAALQTDVLNSLAAPRFSFVEKGVGVQTGLAIDEAVAKYRTYYKQKLATMRVPVIYTKTQKPDWLEENKGN